MARQKYTIKSGGWRIEWQRFTKTDAKRALEKAREDRGTDASWVAALARTMDLGLWETYSPSQTPVAFDRDGFRLNGKHRLAAFLQSSLTEIVFPVIRGLEPREFALFDQNIKTRKHNVAHNDWPNVYRDEARINWLEALSTGETSVKVTTQTFAHLAKNKWRRQIEWAAEAMPRQGRQGKAPYAAAFMYAHRVDPEFTDKIARAWSNGGAGLPTPLLRLRDGALTSLRYGDRRAKIGLTFKVLNALAAMHQGRQVPDRLNERTSGLRYFSDRLRDGAAARWEKRIENEEA